MGELSEIAERIKGFKNGAQKQTGQGYVRQDIPQSAKQDKPKRIPKKRMHSPAKRRQCNALRVPAGQQNIKLRGEAKNDYLDNFRSCAASLGDDSYKLDGIYSSWDSSSIRTSIGKDAYLWIAKIYPHSKQRLNIHKNLFGLAHILQNKPNLEISSVTGMPSAPTMLAIDYASKNKDKELKELKSKISSGFPDEDKEKMLLEEMLVIKMKSKIYDFDTNTAEVIQAEGKPLHEILAPEFALRDRKNLLDALMENDFRADLDIPTTAAMSLDQTYEFAESENKKDSHFIGKLIIIKSGVKKIGYAVGDLSFSGYDFAQGTFSRSIVRFFVNGKQSKKVFSSFSSVNNDGTTIEGLLKPKYQESFGEAFKRGDIGRLYKEASEIRYFHPFDAMKLTIKRFYNAHTDNSGLGVPENFFKDNPNSYVLDIASERIRASYNLESYLTDKNYFPKTEKETTTFRLYWGESLSEFLSESRKGENIKLVQK